MDIIKTYKSNKNMTETERIEHLKQLNRVRRNRCYRKKKMEQLKLKQQQASKLTIKKVNLDEDIEIDSDEEDIKILLELYEYITEKPNDKEILEAIDILEDKLGIDEEDKLNAYDSDSDSDSDSD
jgi:DNA polymerase II large subunit